MTQIHSEPDILVDALVSQIIQHAHTQALLVDVLLLYTNGHDAQIVDAVQRKLHDRQQQAEIAFTQIIKDKSSETKFLTIDPLDATHASDTFDIHIGSRFRSLIEDDNYYIGT